MGLFSRKAAEPAPSAQAKKDLIPCSKMFVDPPNKATYKPPPIPKLTPEQNLSLIHI